MARFNTELRAPSCCPPSLCSTEWGTAVHQEVFPERRKHDPHRDRLIYFSSTFSICPTFFSIFPVLCSALPSASKSGLFLTWPVFSLTLSFNSCNFPLFSCFVPLLICFPLIVESCLIKGRAIRAPPRKHQTVRRPVAKGAA